MFSGLVYVHNFMVVKWNMFQDMCALIVVRKAVMESLTTCPGTEIVDCDEDNWVGKKRSVECDDSCLAVPNPTEVYECGGWQEFYSKIVVDCTLEEWTPWIPCSVACGAGFQNCAKHVLIPTR